MDDKAELQMGQRFKVDLFSEKEKVDVSGISKGKGFAGVIKRHHFRGGAATHGSMFHRAPGSIGGSSFPSRVFPGMRAAGRMGGDRVTLRNLTVVEIDAENNLMLVEGAVPGATGSYIVVRKAKVGTRSKTNSSQRKADKPVGKNSMEINVINMKNEPVEKLEMPDSIASADPNKSLFMKWFGSIRASGSQGTAATKTRGLVSGSGRKLWRQKGTGRARIGSIRSPLWRHGGTVFGPQPRDYSYSAAC